MAASPLDSVQDLPSASGLTSVNRLVPIGREGALEALTKAQVSGVAPEPILLIARVLFVPTDEATPLPRLELGQADVDEAKAIPPFPLFPFTIQGDIPFLIITGYNLGGETDPSYYLDWCRRRCRVRDVLRPHDDPLRAVDALCRSEEWAALGLPGFHDEMLRAQARRLLLTFT